MSAEIDSNSKVEKHLRNIQIPQIENNQFKNSLRQEIMGKAGVDFKRKKTLFIVFPLATAAAAALIVLFISVLSPNIIKADFPSFVLASEGNISFYSQDGQSISRDALTDESLKNNISINTAENSSLKLQTGISSVTVLSAGTIIIFQEYNLEANRENIRIQLKKGQIKNSVNLISENSSYQIIMDNTLVSVTGTEFTVERAIKGTVAGTIKIAVSEGIVEVNNYFSITDFLRENRNSIDQNLFTQLSEIIEQKKISVSASIIINEKEINRQIQQILELLHDIDENENGNENNNLKQIFSIMKIEDNTLTDSAAIKSDKEKSEKDTIENKDNLETKADNGSKTDEAPAPSQAEEQPVSEHKEDSTVIEIEKISGIHFSIRNVDNPENLNRTWWKSMNLPELQVLDDNENSYLEIDSPEESRQMLFWAYTLNEDLPLNKNIRLHVLIESELSGPGIQIDFKGNKTLLPNWDSEYLVSSNSELNKSIQNEEYIMEISPSLDDEIKSITVYFIMLPGTSGFVKFSNVFLEVIE